MKCISYQQQLPLFSISPPLQRKHKYHQPTYIPFSSSSIDQVGITKGEGCGVGVTSRMIRTRALPPSPVVLAVAANLTDSTKTLVILQTGALCVLAFWVANFVVPGVVLKNLRSDDDDGEYSDTEE